VELNDWKLAVNIYKNSILMISCINKKREFLTAKSPVFTQLYSALIGLTTLRAHRCQLFFQKDFDHFQDVHSSSWFLFLASARLLGVSMDLIIVTYTAYVTYACVAFGESIIIYFILIVSKGIISYLLKLQLLLRHDQ